MCLASLHDGLARALKRFLGRRIAPSTSSRITTKATLPLAGRYTDGSISIRSIDEVAQKIRDQSDQHNIFLATNKLTADDVTQLQTLTGRRIVSMALSGEAQSLDPNQVSHVEQLICTRSKCAPRLTGSPAAQPKLDERPPVHTRI